MLQTARNTGSPLEKHGLSRYLPANPAPVPPGRFSRFGGPKGPAACNATEGFSMATASPNQPIIPGEPTPAEAGEGGVRRRDFINIAAISFAGVGAAAAVAPLLLQASPSADVRALSSIEVDISKIAPGQGIKTSWRKQPVFIKNMTPAEVQAANAVSIADLRDPQTLADRTKPGKANWLINLGVCTHLGCVPLGIGEGEAKGDFGGYFCPCHGSHYDTAGRIRKGPAPKNLVVPEFEFASDTVVRIG